jgi:hypothetical protein
MWIVRGWVAVGAVVLVMAAGGPQTDGRKLLPEFDEADASKWINSPPLTVAELRVIGIHSPGQRGPHWSRR